MLVAFVVGQTKLIEACVCGRQIAKGWRGGYLKTWIQFLEKKNNISDSNEFSASFERT